MIHGETSSLAIYRQCFLNNFDEDSLFQRLLIRALRGVNSLCPAYCTRALLGEYIYSGLEVF